MGNKLLKWVISVRVCYSVDIESVDINTDLDNFQNIYYWAIGMPTLDAQINSV
jgi:hypothetical protein